MSWRDNLTDEESRRVDGLMRDVQANIGHTRHASSGTKYLEKTDDGYVWCDAPDREKIVKNHSMFPYKSTAMAVDPSEVQGVRAALRKEGCFAEFDKKGRPIITSLKQQTKLATVMGQRTARDGFGHTDEHGEFQHSGRRRADEMREGRSKVRRIIKDLNTMPEEVPAGVVDGVFDQG